MNQINFKNKTILVTGATRGIGKQIADDLHNLGANLLLTGTNNDEINTLNELSVIKNQNKKFYCVDFLNSKSVDKFFDNINRISKIDALVNNAGINRLNKINDINTDDMDDMILVNLSTPILMTKNISKIMIKNNYGRILNIASIFSKISKKKRSIYSSTKFGLHGLTVGSSNDLAKHNILVNSLSPGFIMTDLTKQNLSKNEIESLKNQIPMKRFGSVNDVSSIAIFLLSDLNQYLTGQNIIIDGGFTNI